ncbi:hypothetical protein N7447_001018 [Penicillium robsamsonii]|uniref:uncharacterized protein n=1 Tax=Penicillium robsamsonii TaxID=1792511 RepID=UPI0025475D4D|nr:uncharacterized protein N7447_001018 [Penicillium robsamsonii]KAJ5834992.1 hypothetical protein N7447_001018 [Penicillium robsamsonii]
MTTRKRKQAEEELLALPSDESEEEEEYEDSEPDVEEGSDEGEQEEVEGESESDEDEEGEEEQPEPKQEAKKEAKKEDKKEDKKEAKKEAKEEEEGAPAAKKRKTVPAPTVVDEDQEPAEAEEVEDSAVETTEKSGPGAAAVKDKGDVVPKESYLPEVETVTKEE